MPWRVKRIQFELHAWSSSFQTMDNIDTSIRLIEVISCERMLQFHFCHLLQPPTHSDLRWIIRIWQPSPLYDVNRLETTLFKLWVGIASHLFNCPHRVKCQHWHRAVSRWIRRSIFQTKLQNIAAFIFECVPRFPLLHSCDLIRPSGFCDNLQTPMVEDLWVHNSFHS